MRAARRADDGLTLVETLAALAVIAVGLLAVAGAFQSASTGIETGAGETTATFLAEARLEELKALALTDWTSAALDAGTTTEYCAPGAAACTVGPNAGSYRRTTTIVDDPGATCAARCKRVHVTVIYRPLSVRGELDAERQVDLVSTFVPRT